MCRFQGLCEWEARRHLRSVRLTGLAPSDTIAAPFLRPPGRHVPNLQTSGDTLRKDPIRRFGLPLSCALALAASLASEALAQWQISAQDGKSTLKIGFLVQPQGEWIDTADSEPLRRTSSCAAFA
jgi:hypothetical protein